ncbi:hypothetical protein QBC45DRAFT_416250 [Copromyces sp. CBS 386.78]|nr:hypothetical protein QBC45DRAFT_416250 [Copromyces sp. CBS 386.78]
MCWLRVFRYATCACVHEWAVPCNHMLLQGPKPQEQGGGGQTRGSQHESDDSRLSSLSPLSSLSDLSSMSGLGDRSDEGDNIKNDEEIIEENKPKVVAFLKDRNPNKKCGYRRYDRDVTTFDLPDSSSTCPACHVLIGAGKDPRYKSPETKMVRDVDVVEMPLMMTPPSAVTPRSYYYIHRRKFVLEREGNEDLEELEDATLDDE